MLKISIITVTYNSEVYLQEAINSVVSQDYTNIEYIIVDGQSTDNTLTIIKQQQQLSKFITEADSGIYDAMNKGVSLSTGEVIGLLNSDDIYTDEGVLSDVMKCFNEDPDLDVLYGNLVYVKKNDTNQIVRRWISKPYYNNFFEDGNVPPHPALFVRSRVYKEVGLFDLQYKLASDYEFMFRVLKKHNFKSKYIDRLTVKMRLGGATNKSIKNIINGNKEILKAWKNNGLKPPLTLMIIRILKRLVQFV
ncbi:MAG: glycosyltransferase family 2 protein [Bacteroidota bacterium]